MPLPVSLALITGYPGFIGRRLVAKLLADDPKLEIAALVEPKMAEAARDAATGLGDDGKRIEVIAGDIGEQRLGLTDDAYERLTAETGIVYHLAAIYSLAVPLELAQRVNVSGTGNVLDFCVDCKKLERLAYVSTAYVAGRRKGVVYEHELTMGQEFKNHYESTKYQAEVWVREMLDKVPTTILRPAIVVGDSETGETQKFDGPYFILRSIAQTAARTSRPMPRFGRSDAPFNAVPVDFIVDAIAAAAASPDAAGHTLHLVDPEPETSGELFDLLSTEYTGHPTKGRIPPRMVAASLKVKPVQAMFGGAPPESIAYLNHPVLFDTRRARQILDPAGVTVPRLRDYVPALVEFFKQHEDDESFIPG